MRKLYFHKTTSKSKYIHYHNFYIASIKTLEGATNYYSFRCINEIYGIGNKNDEFFYENFLLYPLKDRVPENTFTYNNADTYKVK